MRTWVQLVRTFYRLQRRLEQELAAHDMTVPQFDVLATLGHAEGITQQELAERLLVTKGNVCGLLDRLEKAGWVERRPDLNDRRVNRLYLAPAGRRKMEPIHRQHEKTIERLLSSIGDGQLRSLRNHLESLDQALED